MDKVITSMLLTISAVIATIVVINAILPAVQRAGSDITQASDIAGERIRSDVRIIEISGIDTDDFAQVWAKNVGASRIDAIDKSDVFFGPTNNFTRAVYDATSECPTPAVPPRTVDCWQYSIEDDTDWSISTTVRITVYLSYDLAAGTEYVITVVLPTGIVVSQTFTV
jgi:hypothetical protein